tara:strand:- start:670 stop:792 length:123 start_codon:yes stop_codon:yes gene_type:complete
LEQIIGGGGDGIIATKPLVQGFSDSIVIDPSPSTFIQAQY